MNKALKIVLIILSAVLILWSANFIVDLIRYKDNQPPLLATNTTIYDYADGFATEYVGLGYKYIECQRGSNSKTVLVPFWVSVDDIYTSLSGEST